MVSDDIIGSNNGNSESGDHHNALKPYCNTRMGGGAGPS